MVIQNRVSIRRIAEICQNEWTDHRRLRDSFHARTHRRRLQSIQQRRATERPNTPHQWATYHQLEYLNRTLGFEQLSETDKVRLETEARHNSSDSVLDRKVCFVTDVWVFPRDATRVSMDELPFKAMRAVLSKKPWCTPAILCYYDCSDIDARLDGMLLSRRAHEIGHDGKQYVWISSSALKDLQATERRLTNSAHGIDGCKPPRFAIADCFVAGAFSEIDAMTVIERQAVGLAQVRGVVKVVYGGPGNMLQSHLLCWDNRDATIACRVPSVVGREQFQLILAGPMTTPQELLLAKRHECIGARVNDGYDLLCRINALYGDVEYNSNFDVDLQTPSEIINRLEPDEDTDHLVAQARARQSSVARMKDDDTLEQRECTVVETETVLVDTAVDKTEEARLSRAFASVVKTNGRYVAYRSKALLKSTDPHYLEILFPHLLTFGTGGFSVARAHQYTRRDIVIHYLNLGTHRFAQDPMFKLVMFDHLASLRVKNGVFIRVGQDPQLATTVMKVTPEQLRVAMRNRAEQRKAWKRGRAFTPAPEANTAARVLKSIHASTSHMWGSNEEREVMTRKVDAMTIRFGAPSVFWTLTPNPDCSITCAFWAGQDLPNGRPEQLSECTELHMPCSSEMSRLIMNNTVVQAVYYRVCCHLLIDILFGWDSKSHKPKSQRGIFGFLEAFVYALEQQGRLFVHHHGVAWIAGMPKTQSDWEKLLANPQLKERYERYCASIFSAELPIFATVSDVTCPRPGCNGSLEPVPVPKKYKHVLKRSVAAPVVAKCRSCAAHLCETSIVQAEIEKQWLALDEIHRQESTPAAVENIRLRFAGLSTHPATATVQLSRLLLKDQVHAFTHSASCVKGRIGTKCRYKFFRELVQQAGFNSKDALLFRRRLGNQWLNQFVELWRRILHFNMDCRLLWSGQGLQAARYALQYTMKTQNVVDNVAVVALGYKKRIEREPDISTSGFGLGIGRLLSLARANSGAMEMGGPLATTIIMEGEAVTCSCRFSRLVLVEGINILNDRSVEASVVAVGENLYTETSIGKYLARPQCLEDYSWYEFCSWFERVGPSTAGCSHTCSFVSASESDLRDHVRNHNLRYVSYPNVPEIIGPRLPDASRLGDEDFEDQTELYYRIAVLLYRPFRDVKSLLDEHGSARTAYTDRCFARLPGVVRSLEHHQQYYIGLAAAKAFRDGKKEGGDGSDDDEVYEHEDVERHTHSRSPNADRARNAYSLVPAELYLDGDIDDNEGPHYTPPLDPTPEGSEVLALLLDDSIRSSSLPPDHTESFTASDTELTKARVVESLSRCESERASDNATLLKHNPPPEVTVSAYTNAIQSVAVDDSRAQPLSIQPFAPICDVSRYFRLNHKQHIAFTLIAIPLISLISGNDIPLHLRSTFNTSPIIITGAGGTGKSRIVAAVKAIASAWGGEEAVRVVASTGIAAAALNGSTMHSAVSLGLNPKVVSPHVKKPKDDLLRAWAPTLCVIADEVSMVNLTFLGLWEESLRSLKENHDQPYGGILQIFMFDHCQLRAVKGASLYKKDSAEFALTAEEEVGGELYQAIDKVVYLTENMRFTEDPEWGAWLAESRLGSWNPALREFIASLPEHYGSSRDQGHIETISAENQTRTTINATAIDTAVRLLPYPRKVFVAPARLSRPLSPHELSVLRGLPDNKTGHIPLFLHLYIGMPVRIKANQFVNKGVVNGASAVVYHIDWSNETTHTPQSNGTWLASAPPVNVYVDIRNSTSPERLPLLPSHWPPSVMPVLQTTASVDYKGPSVTIKGYPIIPAFGATVHGIQGETRHAIALTNLRPPHYPSIDKHALYVALSRLTTRRGLFWIGSRPSPEDYVYFSPQPDVLCEDRRLRGLSDSTVHKYTEATSLEKRGW